MARKKRTTTKNRVADVMDNGNGAEATDTIKLNAPERIPADEATYLAAQLHEARAQLIQMKAALLQKDKLLLQKDQVLLQKEDVILKLEARMIDEENSKLRVQHKLEFDKTIHKDDATGEVYWLKEAPAAK